MPRDPAGYEWYSYLQGELRPSVPLEHRIGVFTAETVRERLFGLAAVGASSIAEFSTTGLPFGSAIYSSRGALCLIRSRYWGRSQSGVRGHVLACPQISPMNHHITNDIGKGRTSTHAVDFVYWKNKRLVRCLPSFGNAIMESMEFASLSTEETWPKRPLSPKSRSMPATVGVVVLTLRAPGEAKTGC